MNSPTSSHANASALEAAPPVTPPISRTVDEDRALAFQERDGAVAAYAAFVKNPDKSATFSSHLTHVAAKEKETMVAQMRWAPDSETMITCLDRTVQQHSSQDERMAAHHQYLITNRLHCVMAGELGKKRDEVQRLLGIIDELRGQVTELETVALLTQTSHSPKPKKAGEAEPS